MDAPADLLLLMIVVGCVAVSSFPRKLLLLPLDSGGGVLWALLGTVPPGRSDNPLLRYETLLLLQLLLPLDEQWRRRLYLAHLPVWAADSKQSKNWRRSRQLIYSGLVGVAAAAAVVAAAAAAVVAAAASARVTSQAG
jgi:hypothetical protein